MVSRFALIAAASLMTAVATAQTPPGAPGAPAPDMDRIALLLDLDETQKTEVERILEEQHAQINTARAQGASVRRATLSRGDARSPRTLSARNDDEAARRADAAATEEIRSADAAPAEVKSRQKKISTAARAAVEIHSSSSELFPLACT